MHSPYPPSPNGSSHKYAVFKSRARGTPDLLTREEELALVARVRKGDAEARRILVQAFKPLIEGIARRYKPSHIAFEELGEAAKAGFLDALAPGRFDPARGFRLATYAQYRIMARLSDCFLDNMNLAVHFSKTATNKKAIYRLGMVLAAIKHNKNAPLNEAQITALAESKRVEPKVIHAAIAMLTAGQHVSLYAPISDKSDSQNHTPLIDTIAADTPHPEDALVHKEEGDLREKCLAAAFQTLEPREADIFRRRRLLDEPDTYETLRVEYRISRVRVYQIEKRAFEKLQLHVRAAMAANAG